MKHSPRPLAARGAALCVALAIAAGAPVGAQTARNSRPAREPVTLNFVNADIEAVARTMAAITGRNIVVDPRVKGSINLSTERPVPPQVAYSQFLATLRLSGFTVVESNGLLKLVPEADAKLQGGSVNAGPARPGGEIVTQIFRLNYEQAGNMVPILRPLISPNNTINVNPGNNSLVITDYADNLQRIGRIIAALDVSNATDVDILPLQHALAADIAPVVGRLVESSAAAATGAPPQAGVPIVAGGDASFRTTVIAEPRSNSLIVRAPNAARLNLVRSLVQKLDQPSSQNAMGNIYVVYLKNAEATRLAVTLRAAIAAMGTGTATAGGGGSSTPANTSAGGANAGAGASPATAPTTPAAPPSTGGQIQADPATNSLIITAPEPQYRQIRAVIDRLDSRRAQVYVESLIAEVSADKAAQFGIQWQSPIGNQNNTNIGVLGTNFTVGGQNIISLATQAGGATGASLPSAGINIGLVRQVAGGYVLSFLAQALQSSGEGNVLSTPNLLTLDNEEAKIVIGQNVPFVTGQFTNTGASNGSVNPFQTIERKDVGLTLRVKPQISENGTVKMQIFQEVSSVDPTTVNSTNGPTTNKRSIESQILVDDGSIVVLGGLLQDDFSESKQQVPVLGDVPVVGELFKTRTRSRKKTNLMVFLRPVVIRDAAQSDAVSLDRYDLMRTRQAEAQPAPSAVLPVTGAAQLPPAAAATVLVAPASGTAPAPQLPAPAPAPGMPAAPAPAPAPSPAVPAPLVR